MQFVTPVFAITDINAGASEATLQALGSRWKASTTVDRETEDFLANYLKELNENNAAVFVGAGLSKAAGYVDWPG